jgi:protein TonB
MKSSRVPIAAIALLFTVGCGNQSAGPTTPSPPAVVYAVGDAGVAIPTVITEVKPSYTAEAIAARIQGRVLMSAVVLADGAVGDVSVVTSLDTRFGLDAQAIAAAKRWVFSPGTKDGRPVAVRVAIEMTFTLI